MSTAPVHSIMHVHIYLQDVCLMSLWLVASVHLLFQTQATIDTQAPLRLVWAGHFYSTTEDGSRSFSEVQKMGIRSEWDKAFCWQSVMFPSLPRTIQSQKYNWKNIRCSCRGPKFGSRPHVAYSHLELWFHGTWPPVQISSTRHTYLTHKPESKCLKIMSPLFF